LKHCPSYMFGHFHHRTPRQDGRAHTYTYTARPSQLPTTWRQQHHQNLYMRYPKTSTPNMAVYNGQSPLKQSKPSRPFLSFLKTPSFSRPSATVSESLTKELPLLPPRPSSPGYTNVAPPLPPPQVPPPLAPGYGSKGSPIKVRNEVSTLRNASPSDLTNRGRLISSTHRRDTARPLSGQAQTQEGIHRAPRDRRRVG
jgi:hypothetical protein